MKKLSTVLALVLFVSVGAFAQGLSGGVKLGLNLANQTYSGNGYTTSPSFLPGFQAGGYLTAMLGEHFGIQPEVLYNGYGAKSGDQKLKLAYISVPVLARYNVNDLLSFHAGPQFGILASAKNDYNGNSEDIKDQLKKSDVSIAAGVGIDLPMKLNFGFRFVKGLSNIADDEDGSSVTVKNYALQFSVGYTLFGK